MCGPARSRNDDFQPSGFGLADVFEKCIRGPVGGDDAAFTWESRFALEKMVWKKSWNMISRLKKKPRSTIRPKASASCVRKSIEFWMLDKNP